MKPTAVVPKRTDDSRTAFDEIERLGLGILEVPADTVYRNNEELREVLREMYGRGALVAASWHPRYRTECTNWSTSTLTT